MIKTPIGDGQSIEIDPIVRNPNIVPYREAILLARTHLNKEAPQRGQEEDPEVVRLAVLLIRVMYGQAVYMKNSIVNNVHNGFNIFKNVLDDSNNKLSA